MFSRLKNLSLALLAFGTAGSLFAGSFTYSYTFQDGDVVSGSFNGTQSGNLITDLSNITLFFNGVAATNNPVYGSSYNPIYGWVSGGAVASFDGTMNNFLFIDSDYPNNVNYTQFFYALTPVPTGNNTSYALSGFNGSGGLLGGSASDSPFNPANWSVNGAGVPDAAATLPLASLGLGLLLLARRRR